MANIRTMLMALLVLLAAACGSKTGQDDSAVTEDELQRARRFFSGSLPLSLQTNDQLATRVLEQELFELEEEFWLRDIDRMDTVTVETVNAMARRYLHPEIFTVVCLADFRGTELRVPSV